MADNPIIRSAFDSAADEFDRSGRRPVVFDVLGPDNETSLVGDLKLVLHVNPSSMRFTYQKTIERTQTKGGWVEFHWGSNPSEIAFEAATGGFVRLHTGLTATTGPGPSNDLLPPSMRARDAGGTRRETIAYDKYLDLLALYRFNGSIYDSAGNIALQGRIRVVYDGGLWDGWFSTFSVEETAERPYQFALTANFTVEKERHRLRSTPAPRPPTPGPSSPPAGSSPAPLPSAPEPFRRGG